FGIAMEGTKLGSMKDEWLKDLMSWCFYGPILLFFLWLSIILVSVIADVMAESQTLFNSVVNIQNLDANNELSNFFMKLAGMLIPYITAIYLLFYRYDKAKSTSSGMATKILDAGSKKISDLGAKTRTAAYQTTLPGTREAMSEAAKNRMEKHEGSGQWITRRLTKKGREDLQSERTAKWKGGVIGGDKGVAEREYYRGKAQETLKEWKNNPPDNNKLEKMFNSSSEAERVAATLYRSQNNQLGFDKNGNNLYTQGLKNLEGHDGLKNSITRETGRENIAAVIDQEIESRGYGNSDPVGAVKIQELYQQKLGKKNNRALFKDQNREFYLKEGALRPEALEYLYERSKGLDKDARAKMADAGFFKDQQVYQELAKTDEGKVILGITA
ncbi:MAG: hypothetical protein KAQ63_03640, partial [Candidatus Moranbacteria bacterium]|nr:hypothetical protein [Candidatus Moranbacteria bacterium]